MRKALFVRQADIDRDLVQIGEGEPVRVEVLADFEDGLLGEVGDHIDRVELGDFGQRRLLTVAADDIAGVDQVLASDPGKKGP
jgi:hypothetical protein